MAKKIKNLKKLIGKRVPKPPKLLKKGLRRGR